MLKNFYKNKKVVITGHTGFKGTWLTLWLLLLGAKIIEQPKLLRHFTAKLEPLK